MNSSTNQTALAVVGGVRTPFVKAFSQFEGLRADELGRLAVTGVLERIGMTPHDIDEVVMGNVSSPAETSNIARVISLKSGIPEDRPAHTVNRNCASGMESVISGWQILREGRARTVIAGGAESMSNVPLLWNQGMKRWLMSFQRASMMQRVKLLTQLKSKYLKPVAGLELGLTDPVCGLNMGETAEVLAKEFQISRAAQDEFALHSHQRATAAWDRCFYKGEVVPVETREGRVEKDIGPRSQQTLEALARLKPIFDTQNGTVTAGNSCPITDGAAALVLMLPEQAEAKGLEPLGYIRGFSVVGCDPRRMGLGPVYAVSKLLESSGLTLQDFDLFEITEAFAAQVLACFQAFDSETFAQQELGRSHAMGEIDPDKLNVHGGTIALGHPVGVTGTRLILTLMRSLQERKLQRGIATLCVGGGQGVAIWVERTLEHDASS